MTRQALPRRTLLRGAANAAFALPLLEAMRPRRAAAQAPPVRFAVMYLPSGPPAVTWNGGKKRTTEWWHPADQGETYTHRPLTQDLQPFAADITMINGVFAVTPGSGSSQHPGFCAGFLSGRFPPNKGPLSAAVTSDQIIAKAIGNKSRMTSMPLSPPGTMPDFNGQSGIYGSNLSWADAITPVPRMTDPQQTFDEMFAAGVPAGATSPEEARRLSLERIARKRSILDFVLQDAARLQQKIGGADRRILDQYMTNVRSLEQRLGTTGIGETAPSCKTGTRPGPAGTPYDLSADLNAKLDLMALAFQCDLSRVATILLDFEGGNRDYGPILGPAGAGAYHATSHEANAADTPKYTLMVKFHVGKLAYLLGKLKAAQEAGSTVLDRSIVLFGTSVSNFPNLHNHENLPIVLAGRGGGALRPGRSIMVPGITTLKMLNLTLIKKMGIDATSFAGETKTIDQI